MKQFLKDVFEYHHHFNQKLTDLFIENVGKLSERTQPLFSHCINAHQIWNARINSSTQLGVDDVHAFEQIKSMDDENYTNTLEILKNMDIDQVIAYTNSKGLPFKNSVQKILFHVANHFTHHKGQLISDLREKGIQPLVTDYIYYQNK